MNENLQPQMLAISQWLKQAVVVLRDVGITTAQLDAEIILAHTLKQGRTYLHAHPDHILELRAQEIADARLELRRERVPVAYIIGHKEFYGRKFIVSTATLIPRPESEVIIDLVKELVPHNQSLFNEGPLRLIDVGTGSGCLGITLKKELPDIDVTLSDISTQALQIAKKNADQLHAHLHVIKSDLLLAYPFEPDIIVANLPYVDSSWERSPETNFEPKTALFASDNGIAFIKKLIVQASTRLQPHGFIILEADPQQHQAIIDYATSYNLSVAKQEDYIVVLKHNVV